MKNSEKFIFKLKIFKFFCVEDLLNSIPYLKEAV